MKSWAVTFKDGHTEQQENWYQLNHGDRDYTIKELLILEEEVQVGHLWWKKTVKKPIEKLSAVITIPIENVLKIEHKEIDWHNP